MPESTTQQEQYHSRIRLNNTTMMTTRIITQQRSMNNRNNVVVRNYYYSLRSEKSRRHNMVMILFVTLILFLSSLQQQNNNNIVVVVAAYGDRRDMYPINIMDGTESYDIVYSVIVAKFGSNISTSVKVNLMLPPTPSDEMLCTFPPMLLQNQSSIKEMNLSNTVYTNQQIPIGMIVRRGQCSAEQKARTLVQIGKKFNISTTLQYLIIYESDPEQSTTWISFTPNNESLPPPSDLLNIGIMYLPFVYVTALEDQIIYTANITKANPSFFRDPSNQHSQLLFRIAGPNEKPITGGHPPNNTHYPSNNPYESSFVVFRFILFGILLLSPILRAAYLWYAGGGRVLLRRNENGYIIGLQYIPPIPWWLTAGRFSTMQAIMAQQHAQQAANAAASATKDTLTEDQFNALPEIIYSRKLVDLDDEDNVDDDDDDDDDDAVTDVYDETDPPTGGKGNTINADNHDDVDITLLSMTQPPIPDVQGEAKVGTGSSTNEKASSETTKVLTDTTESLFPPEEDISNLGLRSIRSNSDDDVEKQLKEALERDRMKLQNERNNLVDSGGIDDVTSDTIQSRAPNTLDSVTQQQQQVAIDDINERQPHHDSAIITTGTLDQRMNNDEDGATPSLPHANSTSSNDSNDSTYTTTCTSCSICLEDFIFREKLILLPRCKHAFHKNCLYPWLLERNGSCPLCKTSVIEDEVEESSLTENNNNNEATGSGTVPLQGVITTNGVTQLQVPSDPIPTTMAHRLFGRAAANNTNNSNNERSNPALATTTTAAATITTTTTTPTDDTDALPTTTPANSNVRQRLPRNFLWR